MPNLEINNNIFYTLTSDADDIGSLNRITLAAPAIVMHFKKSTFSNPTYSIEKDSGSGFRVLRVVNETGMTNYTIQFDVQQDFKRPSGKQSIEINFMDPAEVTGDKISNLINLLNLAQVAKLDSSNSSGAISALMSDIRKALDLFPQSQLQAPLDEKIEEITSQINADQATLDSYNSGKLSQTQKDAIDPDALKESIAVNKFTLALYKNFAPTPGTNLSGAVRNKIENNFNKFDANFRSQYDFVYGELVKTGQVNSSNQRSKNSSAIGTEATEQATPGLSVDPTNQVLSSQANSILASNQVIQVVNQSGTNVFGPHQPFDQTMSILDVMRNENAGVAYTSNINVQQNIGQGTETGDVTSICSKLYENFSVSDINNMIKSLQNKLSSNQSTIDKLLVSIKRIQSNGNFQFMSAFSGFGGINFPSLDTSKLTDLDFEGLNFGAKNGIKSIAGLTVPDIGGQFGQAVSKVTGAVTDQAQKLYGNTLDSMNSVNFKRALDGIDPDVLRKCPSLSNIKSVMQNPDAVVTTQLSKTKQSVAHVTKAFENNTQELQQVVQQNDALQEQITSLQTILQQKNP